MGQPMKKLCVPEYYMHLNQLTVKQETLKEAIKEHLYANAFLQQTRIIRGLSIKLLNALKLLNGVGTGERNHVWHDAAEAPDGKRRYLVETHLGKRTHHSVWTKAFTPKEKVEDDDVIVRWAYLEDILPLPCKEGDKHE